MNGGLEAAENGWRPGQILLLNLAISKLGKHNDEERNYDGENTK